MPETRAPLSAAEIQAFQRDLSNWGRWGERDQLGALNLITPAKRVAAAALVRSGRTVSCARPLPTEPMPENPSPVVHLMTATATEGFGGDYFAMAPHGFATSHIDALCHIFNDGKLYNGYATDRVTAHGALELAIHELKDGIVSRGVLLDVPRARGVAHLEPGEPIFVDDLERAEAEASVRVEEGDVLLVHTGRWAYRDLRGGWDARTRLAGLDASCLPWLRERGVAALGSDGVSDVLPSRIEGMWLPIHTVAIATMGLHLLDNLDLGPLARACAEERRWAFLLTVAPLVLQRGTASPVNPIALF
ncbi:MAG TPA: cyclase family protein [Candidatus Binatia bacterium]|nr:cyclase family protein [Candidatus Binatia bacterium]